MCYIHRVKHISIHFLGSRFYPHPINSCKLKFTVGHTHHSIQLAAVSDRDFFPHISSHGSQHVSSTLTLASHHLLVYVILFHSPSLLPKTKSFVLIAHSYVQLSRGSNWKKVTIGKLCHFLLTVSCPLVKNKEDLKVYA